MFESLFSLIGFFAVVYFLVFAVYGVISIFKEKE